MSEVEITRSASIVSDPSLADVFILKRGEMVNLTRLDPTLKRIMIGIGWDVIGFDGEAPDLDVSLFMLDKNDKTAADEDFVFYNNLKNADGSVEHMGDNRTGAGEGDDENIRIDLMRLPFDVRKVAFSVSIYEAPERGHSFRSVRNCFLRIVNEETEIELMRFNLDAEFLEDPQATAVLVGVLNREGPNWFFEGVGRLEQGGLAKLATEFGIVVAM